MIIFVPRDGIGPMLIGSDDKEEYEQPPGYDTVRFVGAPERTFSSGAQTAHAEESVVEALRLAETNQFSEVYFSRSFTTVTSRMYQSLIRPDVVAVARPDSDLGYRYKPWEIRSPGQTHESRDEVMPRGVPGIRAMQSRAYTKLLKLMRDLGVRRLHGGAGCS